jgi:hypothetical protein
MLEELSAILRFCDRSSYNSFEFSMLCRKFLKRRGEGGAGEHLDPWQDFIPPGMDPQFRIDGVIDGVLLAMEWASNCVFRLFECVCDVATIWIMVDSDDVDGSHVFSV